MRLAALGAVVIACSACTLVLEPFPRTGTDGDADVDQDADDAGDTDLDVDADADIDADPDRDVDPDRDPDPDTEADVDPDVDPEPDAELDADPEPDGEGADGDGGDCDVAGHMGTSHHGAPCSEDPETWRCVWEDVLECWCSQVCRGGVWQNYNCYLVGCEGCCEEFSSDCTP